MKKLLKFSTLLIIILVILYFVGPKVKAPILQAPEIKLPTSLVELEKQINNEESATKGLKPDNQARIIWADSTKKEKTKFSILYIHGFTATYGDGAPINTNIAKKLNANLYLFRNAHHGVDLGDDTMINASADDYYNAAEKALAIAQKLGENVIVMGTSLGGALTLYLASKHPEIKAIVLYSPGIKPKNEMANLMTNHWGLKIAELTSGSSHIDIAETNSLNRQYWSTRFHLNGAIASLNLINHTMTKETFEKIKCPTLLCYWYKNEEIQDQEVSVSAMLAMFNQLNTPDNLKKKIAFPNANNHVIGSYITSKSYKDVEQETLLFLNKIVPKL